MLSAENFTQSAKLKTTGKSIEDDINLFLG